MAAYDDIPRLIAGAGSVGQPLRRLGIVGDVHAEDELLARAIERLRVAGAERIVCVGDVPDGLGDLDRTMRLLEEHGVMTIRGNHERWFLHRTMRTLRNVHDVDAYPEADRALRFHPPLLEASTIGGSLLVCHAVGRDDMTVLDADTSLAMARWMPEFVALEAAGRFRFVVAGHTHRFFVRRFPEFIWLNAGTLKRDDDPCCVLLDLEAGEVQQHVLLPEPDVLVRRVSLDALA